MIRAHKQAILERLRADSILTSSTFDGVVTGKPTRYCNVYMNSGARDSYTLTAEQAQATFSFTIHSVGSTPEQAQAVAERVFAQLLDFRPTVPGRSCWRVRHEASQPLQVDRDVDPWLWFCVDVFDLTSVPA